MTPLNKEDIYKLAELSKIGINDDEAESLQKDVLNILQYISLVSDYNADDLEKVINFHSIARNDNEREVLNFSREILLQNIPNKDTNNLVKVSKVLKK